MRSLVLPSRQFQALFLFWLPVAYLICLPTLTVCRLPLTPPALRLFYHLSAACLDPCLLSVYDSAILRYPWCCYQICACLTCCTSNKAAYGSQRHWLCVTDTASQLGKGRNISVSHLRYSAKHNALDSWPIRAGLASQNDELCKNLRVLGPVPNGTLHVHLRSYGLTMAAACAYPLSPRDRVPFLILAFRRVLASAPFAAIMRPRSALLPSPHWCKLTADFYLIVKAALWTQRKSARV